MAITLYPGGDQPVTQNLGLALWDMSITMAENFEAIDTAVGTGGTTVKVNGCLWLTATPSLSIYPSPSLRDFSV